jgi:hypothetical protein
LGICIVAMEAWGDKAFDGEGGGGVGATVSAAGRGNSFGVEQDANRNTSTKDGLKMAIMLLMETGTEFLVVAASCQIMPRRERVTHAAMV